MSCTVSSLQSVRLRKWTALVTIPSSTVGWTPPNQPGHAVPHLESVGGHEVGIRIPGLFRKRYQPTFSWLSHLSSSSFSMSRSSSFRTVWSWHGSTEREKQKETVIKVYSGGPSSWANSLKSIALSKNYLFLLYFALSSVQKVRPTFSTNQIQH